jgi:chemotaxis protein histidine kinase CheA
LKGKAYGIFVTELARHLSRAHEMFGPGAVAPSRDEIAAAAVSFHTIRGGAGFFGLSEIASIAGNLEKLLQRPDFDMAREISGIRGSLENLAALAKKMPAPVTQ